MDSASHDSELAFTGERFVPNAHDVDLRLRADHVLRYLASRELVRGRNVLDIACGEGYGSAMLAETATDVLGLDISAEAVTHATAAYRHVGNLRFGTASATRLPCDGESFDAVVSFETIEHLTAADQMLFIDEVRRVLRPSGLFIASTPNRPRYARASGQPNPFHLHELDETEFLRLLGPFTVFSVYRQSVMTFPVIWDGTERSYWMHSDRAPNSVPDDYLIAVAGRERAARPEASLACLWYDQRLHSEFEERTAWAVQLDKELTEIRSSWTWRISRGIRRRWRALMSASARSQRLSVPVRLAGRQARRLSRSVRGGSVRRDAGRLASLLASGVQQRGRRMAVSRPAGGRTDRHLDVPFAARHIANYGESVAYAERMREEHRLRHQLERELVSSRHHFTVPGTCFVCGRRVRFSVDYSYAPVAARESIPNWREHLICPRCHLNNRMRACVHILSQECAPDRTSHIYLTEQTTPLFTVMSRRHRHLVGSEYLGDGVAFGATDGKAIRNESITRLTFPSDEFDYVLSFDVLEHVPDYVKGFSECFRCLKPGGTLCFTVPFTGEPATLVRASMDPDGTVRHLLPPEYHGDPLSADGCLCFHHFGWDLLDLLRDMGFRDVTGLLYWSREFGYLGADDQVMFLARKPN